MSAKKQLTIIAVAAFMVSVSMFYGAEPSIGMASDGSLKNMAANASQTRTSDQKHSLTVSVGNGSPSQAQAIPSSVNAASSILADAGAGTISTTITTATNNTNPAADQSFTLSGTLKSGTLSGTLSGTPLSEKSIVLKRVDPSGEWSQVGTTTTVTNGSYTFTRSESQQGVYTYEASFAGDTTYAPSAAGVTLFVGNRAPTAALTATAPATAYIGLNFTVTGQLTVKGAGLGWKIITLERSTNNQTFTTLATKQGNATGWYTFSKNEAAAGTYYYRTTYPGNTTVANATSKVVKVTVTAAPRTPTTITTAPTNATVNTTF